MVFGTPTTRACCSANRAATLRVSSPPIATSASSLCFSRLCSTWSTPPSSFIGLTRELPSMVPPSGRMPESRDRSRGITSPSPIRPAHPLRTPNNVSPAMSARRPMARIAALRPGASPPPVRTAILCPTVAYLSAELVTDSGVTEERLLFGAAEYDGDTAWRCSRGCGGRRGSGRSRRRLGRHAHSEETGEPLRCCGILAAAVVDHLCGHPLRDLEADDRREPGHVHERRPASARAVIAPAAVDKRDARVVVECGNGRKDVLDVVGEGLEALIVGGQVVAAAMRRISAVVQEVSVVDADVLD